MSVVDQSCNITRGYQMLLFSSSGRDVPRLNVDGVVPGERRRGCYRHLASGFPCSLIRRDSVISNAKRVLRVFSYSGLTERMNIACPKENLELQVAYIPRR